MIWRRVSFLVGLLFVCLLPFEVLAWLRGPAGWRWAYVSPSWTDGLLALGGMTVFVVSWWWLRGWQEKRPFPALILLFILTLIAQFTLIGTDPIATQFDYLASDQANGYWAVAQEIEDLPTFLRDYPELMPTFRPDPHPRSKPPGIVLLYVGLERLLAPFPSVSTWLGHFARGVRCDNLWLVAQSDAGLVAGVLMGLLTPIFSALIIFPAYSLVARWRDPKNAWLVAGLIAIFPGRLIFTPHMDSLYPMLAIVALWLAMRGVTTSGRGAYAWTATSGLVLGLLTFLSLVNGIVAVVVGLVIAGWLLWGQWRENMHPFFWHGVALVFGTLAIWIVYFALYRVDPLSIYHAAEPARHDLARNYWVWLWGNVYDFALFVGLPLFLLALQPVRDNRLFGVMWGVFWGVFALLDVSGVIRGEVGRIWLMLAGFPILLVSENNFDPSSTNERKCFLTRIARIQRIFPFMTKSSSRPVRLYGVSIYTEAIIGLLAVTTVMMGLFWQVTETEWGVITNEQWATSQMSHSDFATVQTTTFADVVTVSVGSIEFAEQLQLPIRWRPFTRPDIAYKLFIHVTHPETHEIVAQTDQMPNPFSSCWHEGIPFDEVVSVDVSGVANGRYALSLGLYDPTTGQRLMLADGSTLFSLGMVEINRE